MVQHNWQTRFVIGQVLWSEGEAGFRATYFHLFLLWLLFFLGFVLS